MFANKELKKTGFLQFDSLFEDGGNCSLFIDRSGEHQLPAFIWCNASGWDHVIASYSDRKFTSQEEELIKRFFFRPGEWGKVEIQHAGTDEPRPYATHYWLQRDRHAPKPAEHIPALMKRKPWMLKICPAYYPAVSFQAMARDISPDSFVEKMEETIDFLFSGKHVLSRSEQIQKLCFYKQPSAERYFLWSLETSEKGIADIFSREGAVPDHKGSDAWRFLFSPLLHNAVIEQANYNHVSPADFVARIQDGIEKAYSGKDDVMAAHLNTEFLERPDVQSVFLYMVLPKPATVGKAV